MRSRGGREYPAENCMQHFAREHPPILLYSGYGGAPARVAPTGLPLLRKPFALEEPDRAPVAAGAGRTGTGG